MSVYLIDGYNVLHQFLGQGGVSDLEDERTRLIDRIASYMGGTPTGPSWCSIRAQPDVAKARECNQPMWRSISGRSHGRPTASSRGRPCI